MSRWSIYKMMQNGEFPRPVKIGPTAVRWRASDIRAWWSRGRWPGENLTGLAPLICSVYDWSTSWEWPFRLR